MLDLLGNIGEFVGGVGVVVTLVYLAIQIRQNTISTRTSSYQSAVSAANDWSRSVGLDAEVARIIITGNADYESLSSEERRRYGFLMVSLFRNFENIFYQYEQGAIDEHLWNSWSRRMRSVLDQRGAAAWWQNNRGTFTEEFRTYLDLAPPEERG